MSIALNYKNEDILYNIQKSLVLLSNINKDIFSKETAPNYWTCWIFGLKSDKSQSKYLFLITGVNLAFSIWEGPQPLNCNNIQNAHYFIVIAFSDEKVCLKQPLHIFLKSSFFKHLSVFVVQWENLKVIMTIQSLFHSISSLSIWNAHVGVYFVKKNIWHLTSLEQRRNMYL